jgi:hypothetical protein
MENNQNITALGSLRELHALVNDLDNITSTLEQRLGPVLSIDYPTPSSPPGEKIAQPHPELVETVLSANKKLQRLLGKVSGMNYRLVMGESDIAPAATSASCNGPLVGSVSRY